MAEPAALPASNALTFYEKRLLRLRVSGLSMKEIARQNGLAHGTTRNYFSKIYKKLNRAEYDKSLITAAL